jgi:acetoin utilization deacetylase AcuC-like enzyme
MARTGLVYSDLMLDHLTRMGHPEAPERLSAVKEALDEAAVDPHLIPITPATEADLLRVHTPEHVSQIRQACMTGYYPDPDTPMGPGSWEAAMLAAGGGISACEAVWENRVDNAFCAVRPPGHHAETDRAMGFCLFNNVAIAARWLLAVKAVKRVAILDWDVHHGNGTQQAFYDEDAVLFASLHQHPLYPGTGWPSERGTHRNIVNVQVPRGAGPQKFMDVFDAKVLPAMLEFAPDFLLISAGFDGHKMDPLGGLGLETETYAELTRKAKTVSQRVVSILEGGYNLDALGECAAAHFKALQE